MFTADDPVGGFQIKSQIVLVLFLLRIEVGHVPKGKAYLPVFAFLQLHSRLIALRAIMCRKQGIPITVVDCQRMRSAIHFPRLDQRAAASGLIKAYSKGMIFTIGDAPCSLQLFQAIQSHACRIFN